MLWESGSWQGDAFHGSRDSSKPLHQMAFTTGLRSLELLLVSVRKMDFFRHTGGEDEPVAAAILCCTRGAMPSRQPKELSFDI